MKKIISILLTTLMVITIGVVNVSAGGNVAKIGETEYATLQEAINAVLTDGTETTITMVADETIAGNTGVTILGGQNVVLDLNGHTISNLVNEDTHSQVIDNKGTLTVKDSTDTNSNGTGFGKIMNSIQDGTTVGDWWSTPQANWTTNVIENNGIFTILSGVLENTAGGSICYCVDNNSADESFPICYIKGGLLKNDKSSSESAIVRVAPTNSNESKFYMSAGTIKGKYGIALNGNNSTAPKVTIEISGGSVKTQDYALYTSACGNIVDQSNINVSISAGEFGDSIPSEKLISYSPITKFITGGYFSEEINNDYIKDGYECIETTNGEKPLHNNLGYKIGAIQVARIGNKTYQTLPDAIAAAKKGETVVLLKDVTYDLTKAYYYVSWPKVDFILDLNGHLINGNFAYAAFVVQDIELSIVDNSEGEKGKIINNYTSGYGGIMQYGNSTLNLENVTIQSKSDGVAIYNDSNVLNINEGTLVKSTSSSDAAVRVGDSTNVNTANAIYVNGGTAEGYIYGVFAQNYGKVVVNSGQILAQGNALLNNGSNAGETTMIINGGTIDCTDRDNNAIYHPGKGTLTVNGGTIIGGTGIEMRAGTLIIPALVNGTTNTAKITAQYAFSANANANGPTLKGVAVGVSQHTTNYPVRAEIAGGIIKSTGTNGKAFYEVDLQDENIEGISALITGGDFDGIVEIENIARFISGGFYSNDLREKVAYIAPGYECIETNNAEKEEHNNLSYRIGKRTSGKVVITETDDDVPKYYEKVVELQDAIDNITKANQEKFENNKNINVSTITVNNGSGEADGIKATIDDTVKIITNKNINNEVKADPGYKLNNPVTEGGKTTYTAKSLDIGKDYQGGSDGLGKKDSKKTETTVEDSTIPVSQKVLDSAATVNDTRANKQLENIVSQNLNTILDDRGINQGVAARTLNNANIKVTNEGADTTAAKDVNVYVMTYYESKVVADNTSNVNKSYAIDITPMYQPYASIAPNKDSMNIGVNSIKIGNSLPVDCTGKTITLKIKLAQGFIINANQKVYVVHTTKGGSRIIYDTKVTKVENDFYIEFTNSDGFSVFEITTKDPRPTPSPKYNVPNTGIK